MDFDFIQAQEIFEKIVVEQNDTDRFNLLQSDIMHSIEVLDPYIQMEIRRIFEHREKWSILWYGGGAGGGGVFTAGLHSNERAATVDTFFKS
jgi:hypothetical protein